MHTRFARQLLLAAIVSIAPCSVVWSQGLNPQAASGTGMSASSSFDRALGAQGDWYFSWGYSRQHYSPSNIHVSQPGLGNDFTVQQAAASDFPTTFQETLDATWSLDLTKPQENIRIGKFMNAEKTFAIEFSLDHSKYQTDLGQTAQVIGTINNQAYSGPMVLNSQNFFYALHNGLNHIMINGVWLNHLYGPEKQAGDLELISRAGAGILLPHADNSIFGNQNVVGPKNQNICCFASNDWWQLNGWTAGVEVGLRYRVYKSVYLELTTKAAYGALRRVPVYQGSADQTLWMTEQILSTGFLF